MSFIVSARKYRPTRFKDVVGQQTVTTTLKNALKNDKLAQSFLFCGPRGVGKTTCARILAKVINCQNLSEDYEPCGTCDSCSAFNQSASFNIFELDAASNNSVEDIRNLIEQVRFAPQAGKYKIYIIDEVHMLSQAAFNAFLKTLEEPPSYAIFILATTEKHKIIPTILSRCQIFDFTRIKVSDIVPHLQEICTDKGLTAEPAALHIIAQKADGGLRDALSIFDRIASFSDGTITYKKVIDSLNILDYDYFFQATDALLSQDHTGILLLFDNILQNGFEGDNFIEGLASHFRNLLVCKNPSTLALLDVTEDIQERYRNQATLAPVAYLLSALNITSQCSIDYKTSNSKRLLVELTLLKLAYLNQAIDPSQINAMKAVNVNPSHRPQAAPQVQAPVNITPSTLPKPTKAIPQKTTTEKNTSPSSTAPTNISTNQTSKPQSKSLLKSNKRKSTTPKLTANFLNKPVVKEDSISTPTSTPINKDTKVTTDPVVKKSKPKVDVNISADQIKEIWQTYAKQELTGTFEKGHLSIDMNKKAITIHVAGKLTQERLQEKLPNFRAFAQDKGIPLQAFDFQIKMDQKKQEEKQPIPTTHKDIFRIMVQKNAYLKDMVKQFDLEFDM